MLALIEGSRDIASTKDPESFRGSRSASAHLRWSRDINRLYGKYITNS